MENTKDFFEEQLLEFVELLKDKDFKEKFIDALNDDIDIPLLREKHEEKVFKKIYDLLLKHVDKALKKIIDKKKK